MSKKERRAPAGKLPVSGELLSPLEQLHADYVEAARVLTRISEGLAELIRQAPGGELIRQTTAGEVARQSGLRSIEVDVMGGEMGALLDLQERLSHVPGISRITVVGSSPGGSRLLLEVEGEPETEAQAGQPRIVCIQCGKTILEGGPGESHGLCPECLPAFVGRGSLRPQRRGKRAS